MRKGHCLHKWYLSSVYNNSNSLSQRLNACLLLFGRRKLIFYSLLGLDIRKDIAQKVLGEPRGLLIRLLEPGLAAVVRILDDLGLTGARVLAKEHHLGLSRMTLLQALEVGQVGPVHGEDVVELVKVGGVDLFNRGITVRYRKRDSRTRD